MPRGAARTKKDRAGGIIIGVLAPTVFVNGVPISVKGDPVMPHGPGIHGGPVMFTCSGDVFAHGIGVCRLYDIATCGHPATASPDVFVN